MIDSLNILQGDVMQQLGTLSDEIIQTCVTSPPYWHQRDYNAEGQWGLEDCLQDHIDRLVQCFREVKRVLKPNGTFWLNYGDCWIDENRKVPGLRPKNLIGISWKLAEALQQDGWILRQANIWFKTNPMPKGCFDRTTEAYEHVFHFSKNERYYYDAHAIAEPPKYPDAIEKIPSGWDTGNGAHGSFHKEGRSKEKNPRGHSRKQWGFTDRWDKMTKQQQQSKPSNKRNIWTFATQPFPEAHYATFPEELPKTCILAGSRPGDYVLDPFAGSGTTGKVALELGRKSVLIELSPENIALIEKRCHVTHGLPLA